MYAQKAIVHNAPTLHTVRNVHNAHCAYRFKVHAELKQRGSSL